MPERSDLKAGFTLVELLVVIGIIALLISILLPIAARARRAARTAVCLSNLRQLALVYQEYREENNGHSIAGGGRHPGLLHLQDAMYSGPRPVGAYWPVLVCPETTEMPLAVRGRGQEWYLWPGSTYCPWASPDSTIPAATGPLLCCSYGMNDWLLEQKSTEAYDPAKSLSFSTSGASIIPVFGDCIWADSFPSEADPPPTALPVSVNVIEDFGYSLQNFCLARHSQGINLVFADGHAATVQLEELWLLKWNKQFQPHKVRLPARH